jgi:photosystem II stability/assembly factor-like uncharacterized protein
MKKSIMYFPAVLIVLFLLNSFVVKEKEAGEKTSTARDSVFSPNENKSGLLKSVLKSTDGGQTWQNISEGLPEIERAVNIVESEGVLLATGQKGIMRSTDNGKNWQWVISEGGVGIAIERIEGGFAAISFNTKTQSRRIHISTDSGKTWQAIDEGLRPTMFLSSIKQVGKYLVVGHPDGIFRTSDRGKTWKSVHSGLDEPDDKDMFKFVPSWNKQVEEPGNVFKIFVSGDAMYAVAVSAGC